MASTPPNLPPDKKGLSGWTIAFLIVMGILVLAAGACFVLLLGLNN
jgi:hypothetical protein